MSDSAFERARTRVIEAADVWRNSRAALLADNPNSPTRALIEAVDAWEQAGIDAGEPGFGFAVAFDARTEAEMVWVERTMKDVRAGDTIRRPGSDAQTHVSARYLPPMKDGSNAGNWHVVAGARNHFDDRVVKPGEVWLCFNGGAPRNLDPSFPVEIYIDGATADFLRGPGFSTDLRWADRMDAKP